MLTSERVMDVPVGEGKQVQSGGGWKELTAKRQQTGLRVGD